MCSRRLGDLHALSRPAALDPLAVRLKVAVVARSAVRAAVVDCRTPRRANCVRDRRCLGGDADLPVGGEAKLPRIVVVQLTPPASSNVNTHASERSDRAHRPISHRILFDVCRIKGALFSTIPHPSIIRTIRCFRLALAVVAHGAPDGAVFSARILSFDVELVAKDPIALFSARAVRARKSVWTLRRVAQIPSSDSASLTHHQLLRRLFRCFHFVRRHELSLRGREIRV